MQQTELTTHFSFKSATEHVFKLSQTWRKMLHQKK